ncbi:MAG: fucose-binding protein [Geminicoccaceae bacterium]|nr:fucose-binding protein [Geminicoccaceae bacterium]MCB2012500.1 fucose-binding protein [Geminicoccaceae bacterium]
MLIGIDPILNGDVLQVLCDMGHGDTICIADANFPGRETARRANVPWAHLDCDLPRAMRAVLSVMPLDSFVEEAVHRMEDGDDPQGLNEAHRDVKAVMEEVSGTRWKLGGIERFAFYEEALNCSLVISTQERRGYACFILKKGVLDPGGAVI